jgi:hypothetical protein
VDGPGRAALCYDDVLEAWRPWAPDIRGGAVDASHFLADDRPEETAAELLAFLLTRSTEDFAARLTGGGAFGRPGLWRSCCSD